MEIAPALGTSAGDLELVDGSVRSKSAKLQPISFKRAAAKMKTGALAIECAGIGAALGGTCGVVAAAWTALDSLVLPMVGIVLAGPLAAALIGGGIGAGIGVVSGAALDALRARRGRSAA